MKASELIQLLAEQIAQHGDLVIYGFNRDTCSSYAICDVERSDSSDGTYEFLEVHLDG